MSRIFSYFTQNSGKIISYAERYRFSTKVNYNSWKQNYNDTINRIRCGEDIFFEISKTSSSKHGWVGKIKNASELPVISNIDKDKISSVMQNIHYGDYKVNMDFGSKCSTVPINWIIQTTKKNFVTYKPSDKPNKLDMLGTETSVNSYVIYRYDKEIIMGYIQSISPKNKTVYCIAFDGTKRKRIDNPEVELIVVTNSINMYSLMSKKKLLLT